MKPLQKPKEKCPLHSRQFLCLQQRQHFLAIIDIIKNVQRIILFEFRESLGWGPDRTMLNSLFCNWLWAPVLVRGLCQSANYPLLKPQSHAQLLFSLFQSIPTFKWVPGLCGGNCSLPCPCPSGPSLSGHSQVSCSIPLPLHPQIF